MKKILLFLTMLTIVSCHKANMVTNVNRANGIVQIEKKFFFVWILSFLTCLTSCVEQLDIETGVKQPYVYCILCRSYEYQEVKILNIDDIESVEILEEGKDRPYVFTKVSDTLWHTRMAPVRGKTYSLKVIRSGKEPITASTTYPVENHIRDVSFFRYPGVDYSTFSEGTVGHYLYDNYRKSDLIDVWEIYHEDQRCYYSDSLGEESRWWLHYPDFQDIVCDNDFFDKLNMLGKTSDSTTLYHQYLRLYKDKSRGYTIYLCGMNLPVTNAFGIALNPQYLQKSVEAVKKEEKFNPYLHLIPPEELPYLRTLFCARRRDGTQQSFICHNASVELDLYWRSILKYKLLDNTDVLNNMYPEDNEMFSNISNGYGIFGAQDIKWSEMLIDAPQYPDSGMWTPNN